MRLNIFYDYFQMMNLIFPVMRLRQYKRDGKLFNFEKVILISQQKYFTFLGKLSALVDRCEKYLHGRYFSEYFSDI